MSTQRSPDLAVAYIYPQRYHFVAKDITALRERYIVHEHAFNKNAPWLIPWTFVQQAIFLLKCRMSGVRHVIAHFAGYHTILPTLLGFRTHIIIAGSDACAFPKIDYGSFRKPWMAKAMAFSMRNANNLLPVHASLQRFTNTYSDLGPKDQGYAHFVNGPIARSIAIPYGFDVQQWSQEARKAHPQSVLCVATGITPDNAVHFRKGIDLLLEVAKILPDHRFTIIGAADPEAYTGLSDNVRILGKCSPEELREQLLAHSIYAQPSVMEGFPNALCEAMLMGCIPVVSAITSMPDIIGDVGAALERRSAPLLATAIERLSGLPLDELTRQQEVARDRILQFTMERRIAALMALIQDPSA